METAGVEPAPSRCKRDALPPELHPQVRTDGVEPPQPEAPRLQRGELSRAQRPRTRGAAGRIRTGTSGITTPGASRYTTATMRGGDDRARTGDLSPDKRVLSSAELRPRRGKGRAASAARPFQLRGRDSNPRSRAHEAREDGPSSTALVWPAGVEPAISGARSRWGANSPTASRETPGGTRTRVSGLRARRHALRPRGLEAPAAGIEPAPRE